MSGYESDQSMGPTPLTPGLSETHSMQASDCNSEDQNSSPEPSPKRRRTCNTFEPRLNGDSHYTASAASPPGHPTTSLFVPRSPVRRWTTPVPNSLRPSMPTPGLPFSIMPASGTAYSTIPTPGSPRSFGQSREFLPLILSWGLFYNRERNPYPATALGIAALRTLDWRMRMNSWPEASRSQTGAEMDACIEVLKRSNTW